MRTSLSLTSFLASVSSQKRPHITLPIIIVSSPSNDPNNPATTTPNLAASTSLPEVPTASPSPYHNQTFRRWRGGFPGERDLTLYPPKLGLTKGARLMLARQGSATGSFRLNCAETLFAVDEQGRCLYQRMDFEEELGTMIHGSMERPIQVDSESGSSNPTITVTPAAGARFATYSGRTRKRRTSLSRIAQKNSSFRHTWTGERSNASHSSRDRLTLGSLSSANTYTEGLCSLLEETTTPQTLSSSVSLRSFIAALESGKKWIQPAKNEKSNLEKNIAAHETSMDSVMFDSTNYACHQPYFESAASQSFSEVTTIKDPLACAFDSSR